MMGKSTGDLRNSLEPKTVKFPVLSPQTDPSWVNYNKLTATLLDGKMGPMSGE